jgi:hypothetical protein
LTMLFCFFEFILLYDGYMIKAPGVGLEYIPYTLGFIYF